MLTYYLLKIKDFLTFFSKKFVFDAFRRKNRDKKWAGPRRETRQGPAWREKKEKERRELSGYCYPYGDHDTISRLKLMDKFSTTYELFVNLGLVILCPFRLFLRLQFGAVDDGGVIKGTVVVDHMDGMVP